MSENHLEELKHFIRDHRNSEGNFELLIRKLDDELKNNHNDNIAYKEALQEIKTKQVEEYSIAKSKGGSTWPEFENFVSAFEKALIQ